MLQIECGVTQISLENAKILIEKYGRPIHLDIQCNAKKGDYFVEATFADGNKFLFSGFSWGYGGEGPKGLNRFFEMCDMKEFTQSEIPIDKWQKTHIAWARNGCVDGPFQCEFSKCKDLRFSSREVLNTHNLSEHGIEWRG